MEESHTSIAQVQRGVEKDVKEEDITSMEKKTNKKKKTEKNLHLKYFKTNSSTRVKMYSC